jgi:hypothetical protein
MSPPVPGSMSATVEASPTLPVLSAVRGKPAAARFDDGPLASDGGVLERGAVETHLVPDG